MLSMASDDLDRKTTWVGATLEDDQIRAFPRDTVIKDDVEGEVPERILDWVALRAYQLSLADDAPILQQGIDTITQRYTRGLRSKAERYMENLLTDYDAHASGGGGRIVWIV